MSPDKQDLLDLKDKVDEAKSTVSQLTGQQTILMRQLKINFGCKTLKEAEEKLVQMDKNISILDKKIEKGTKELSEKYNFEEEEKE